MTSPVELIWLDNSANSHVQTRLRDIAPNLNVFTNSDACIDHIISACSTPDSVFLIVSGSLGQQVAAVIDALPQLRAVYVFCFDTSKHIPWATQYNKIGTDRMFSQENNLITRLTADLKEAAAKKSPSNSVNDEITVTERNETLSISVFAGNIENKTTRDLTEEKVTFTWLQLLTDILIHMPQLEKVARNDMIDVCRQEYIKDQNELKLIEEYCSEYVPSKAIHWYTRNTFLYRLLNQALRTQNIDIIFKFRSVIADVYKQLNQLFQSTIHDPPTFRVYRGQPMTLAEIERLRGNLKGLISMNSFVSTSLNKNVASRFVKKLSLKQGETVGVLFEMTIDARVAQATGAPFADIKTHSFYQSEDEVLLSMGTVFRVDEIEQETSDLWYIKATMCSTNDDPQLKMLFDHAKAEICSSKMLTFSTYGKFLAFMSHFDSSIAYHRQLLTQLTADHPDLPTIHNDLAYAYRESSQYSKALEHYNIALELKEMRMPRNELDLATTYSDFGWLLMNINELTKSLDLHHKALTIREKYLGHNHSDTAMSYNCLGLCYVYVPDLDLALYYLQEALAIRQNCLPPHYPYVAMSYSSLGSYFTVRKDHSEALKMHQQALLIYKSSVPPSHNILASSYSSVGTLYLDDGQWQKAIEYLTAASNILGKNGKDSQAYTLNYIGRAYFELGDYGRALSSYQEALQVSQKAKNNELAVKIEKSIDNVKKRI